MRNTFFIWGLSIVLLTPTLTFAGPIIRSGDKISVDSSQILKGDFYGFGQNVTLSGVAEDDVYIAGGNITINAHVQNDLSILGGVVQVHGDVDDDLRVVGGTVTVGHAIKGDLVVLGGNLNILSTASIEGDVLFMGRALQVDGPVTGAIHGTSDDIRINAPVGGDISYTASHEFVLGDNARVRGNINYKSRNDIVRAQESSVQGEIYKAETPIEVGGSLLKLFLVQLSILAFASLTLYLVARKQLRSMILKTRNNLGLTGLIGLAVLIVVPFVSVVLMISVIGLYLGIMLLVSYIFLLFVSCIYAAVMLGYYAEKYGFKKTVVTMTTVILGVLILCLLGFIPVIGKLLIFACIVVALGELSTTLYRSLRS